VPGIPEFYAVSESRRGAKSFESNRAMHGAESYEPEGHGFPAGARNLRYRVPTDGGWPGNDLLC
jgi:hypothetical protein